MDDDSSSDAGDFSEDEGEDDEGAEDAASSSSPSASSLLPPLTTSAHGLLQQSPLPVTTSPYIPLALNGEKRQRLGKGWRCVWMWIRFKAGLATKLAIGKVPQLR
mmetsp:Transcript_36346/g.90673  ORF Transcript_36346/g.90673 Transcript_36346/m.90673 type:complete len:105 (+) Transcript_36346:543-857(+)